MFLLADGVAAVTSASGGGWETWTTPQGVAAISGLLVTALSIFATILGLLGKKDLQQKVQDAHDTIQDKNAQIQAAVDALRGVVQGVEQAKGGLTPDAKLHLISTIQEVATKAGGQQYLDPIVQMIQSGKADSATLLQTINDVVSKIQTPAKS